MTRTLLISFFIGSLLANLSAATLPPGFQENLLISGHVRPTAIRFTPETGGPVQAFVAEKSGRIYYYNDLGNQPTQGQAKLVADLSNNVHDYWDRGLLGLAIHPNFPYTPQLFALYAFDAGNSFNDGCADPTGYGCVINGRLARLTLDLDNLGVATTLESPLISGKWCQQYPSHTVGDLHFGADGFLYLSAGEGASFTFTDFGQVGNPCDDPVTGVQASSQGGQLRSQDLLTGGDRLDFHGSVLRLDVSGAVVSAPSDNPLIGGDEADDFMIAIGLRNPFRFTIRPNTNELWLADVGGGEWEEINRLADPLGAIENFGWPCYEGTGQHFNGNLLCNPVHNQTFNGLNMDLAPPFFAYRHRDEVVAGDGCGTGGSSVTGISFNERLAYPAAYDKALFFADSTRQCIWVIYADANGLPDPTRREAFVVDTSGRVVDIQQGPGGQLHYVDFDGGRIYRIDSYGSANRPPQAALTADVRSGPAPLRVHFDASDSTDDQPDSLRYSWDLDGDGQFGDADQVYAQAQYDSGGSRLVQVLVTDAAGQTDSAAIVITVGNSAPSVTIDQPSIAHQWSVGENLILAGRGSDVEDGDLPSEALSWSVIIEHCAAVDDCHDHPVVDIAGDGGSFITPDHEYPSALRFELTGVDSGIDWWDSAWQYRRQLTVNNRGLTAQVDVPILVKLNPARIDYAFTQPGGRDLVFVDSRGERLAHEIERWDATGNSTLWVRLDRLVSGDEPVFLYYGNSLAADSQQPAQVWRNGYAAVWHLSELTDSVAGQALLNVGTAPVLGELGGARSFNGSSNYLNAGSDFNPLLVGDFSVEAYVDTTNDSIFQYPRLISNKNLWTEAQGVNLELSQARNLAMLGASKAFVSGPMDLSGGYHAVAATYSAASGLATVYGQGVELAQQAIGATVLASLPLNIGRRAGGGDYFTGRMDELRLSSLVRSADWLALQQRSLTDQLIDFGAQEANTTLSTTTALRLNPLTADLTLQSEPAGLAISLGGSTSPTPTNKTLIAGSTTSIEALSPQLLDQVAYRFVSWSNAGERAQAYLAPAGSSVLRAIFEPIGAVMDSDEDGLPDDWERRFGLDPDDPSDALSDADDDGLTNLEEFSHQSDPNAADTDADSWDDFTEVTFGGDPNDATRVPNPPIVHLDTLQDNPVFYRSDFSLQASWTGAPLATDHLHFIVDTPPHISAFPDINGVATVDYVDMPDGEHSLTVQVNSVAHAGYRHAGALAQRTFTVDANPATGLLVPGRIEAEAYHRYLEFSAADLGTQCSNGDGVDKQLTTDPEGGGCNVGWTEAGEWLEYDLKVQHATQLSFTARVASNVFNRSFHLELDGVDISGSQTVPRNGWQSWGNKTTAAVPVSAGKHRLRVVFDTGLVNLNFIRIDEHLGQ